MKSPTRYAFTMPVQSIPFASKAPRPPAPLDKNIIQHWALEPSIAFLNHGCFGARPRHILEIQSRLRQEYEARPVEWLERKRTDLIGAARQKVAQFVGANPANLGFVTNATDGINAVLRSLAFKPGDELLTTNHVYNAIRMAMKHAAQRAGARYVEADVPLPVQDEDQIIRVIKSAITDRTRLLVIDHVTSPTALIFPVQKIVELCAPPKWGGVDVLIDGAHAPGMLPLQIEAIGAAYYAGNLHKWVCAPSGAGFLWVRPDRQAEIHPLTISHFFQQGFAREFEWQGSRDITPWLCAGHAIDFLGSFAGGWTPIMQHNHQMATWVQAMLCERWGVEPASPLDGSMLGSMATVPLPQARMLKARFNTPEALQAFLYDEHRIEVPVMEWNERWWLRPCCQIYNTADQFERLADAIDNAV